MSGCCQEPFGGLPNEKWRCNVKERRSPNVTARRPRRTLSFPDSPDQEPFKDEFSVIIDNQPLVGLVLTETTVYKSLKKTHPTYVEDRRDLLEGWIVNEVPNPVAKTTAARPTSNLRYRVQQQ